MTQDILNIEPHVELTTIPIWEPRWHDSVALIATKKIRAHNRIIFTKAKSLAGKEFYISAEKIKKYPKESNGTIMCYVVPMDDLMLMKQKKGVW